MRILTLILLFGVVKAQNYLNVQIHSVTPNPVCAGGIINVCFSYTVPVQDSTTVFSTYFHVATSATTGITQIPNYTMLGHFPKCDSNKTSITLPVPINSTPGSAVVVSSGSAYNIQILTCTSLDEYSLDSPEPEYYDLQGNKIKKLYNQLIIEQVGIRRRKVILYTQ